MEQLVQLLKTSHLIHSWQINNTFSSFLVLVENIKAFTGVQLCFSTLLCKHCSVVQTLQCCANIAVLCKHCSYSLKACMESG